MFINEYIKGFRGRSFFIESELICNMVVLFFQTTMSGWVSLSINEGTSKFSLEDSEPLLLDLSGIDDEFAYPIQVVSDLSDYLGRRIVNIYEYRVRYVENGCVGVYFDLELGGFSILERDGCLSVINGTYNDFKEDVYLSKLEY
ncbi:hypothetical protein [Pectobacterium polaris]|uniref:Uncharacterized protein n=1 Tax=Pectobacterium polaris TaxID=2042057 RepID=A0AAW5G9P5_9GAMM|nr:hypothetical protein [Pectobacterium polaris]MCL6350701.1 hypothetical protein [Pectobacterium polaris]MCL6368099.1 hypothetical protein [Pectobacterium polaris]